MTNGVEGNREKLKPCPFCGAMPKMWNRGMILPWVIQCCGSMVSSDKESLIEKWNTRAIPVPDATLSGKVTILQNQVNELRHALDTAHQVFAAECDKMKEMATATDNYQFEEPIVVYEQTVSFEQGEFHPLGTLREEFPMNASPELKQLIIASYERGKRYKELKDKCVAETLKIIHEENSRVLRECGFSIDAIDTSNKIYTNDMPQKAEENIKLAACRIAESLISIINERKIKNES